MHTGATFTAIIVPIVLRAAEQAGVDVRGLGSRLKLPPAPLFEDRIDLELLIGLWEEVLSRARRPDLPLLAAMYPSDIERSLVMFLSSVQSTAGAVAENTVRYWPTVTDAFQWTLQRTRATFSLVADPPGPLDRLGWRCHLEFEVADMIQSGLRIAGPRAQPTKVTLVHRRPASIDTHVAVLGIEPEFCRQHIEIVYPRDVWDLPISSNRPGLAHHLEAPLKRLLHQATARRSMASKIRALVPALLHEGCFDGDELARRLRMGRRTMERRLDAEGTSLRELVDSTRLALATEWLRDVEIPEIAHRLGYSNVRAFDRAFRRWTGTTPSLYRRSLEGAPRLGE